MENGFRNKETLTRKDMVFGAVNVLATEDKKTLKGVDRLAYVLDTAQALYVWVHNGKATNGSSEKELAGCPSCSGKTIGESKSLVTNDGVELLGCPGCDYRRFASDPKATVSPLSR